MLNFSLLISSVYQPWKIQPTCTRFVTKETVRQFKPRLMMKLRRTVGNYLNCQMVFSGCRVFCGKRFKILKHFSALASHWKTKDSRGILITLAISKCYRKVRVLFFRATTLSFQLASRIVQAFVV